MGAELLETGAMTISKFYYPASIDVALGLARRGEILSPYKYEYYRLRALKYSSEFKERERFVQYSELYSEKIVEHLARKIAALRHPIDVRTDSADTVTENLWLSTVRLYDKLADARKHITIPPVGVVLGLELEQEHNPVIFIPESVALEKQLKEVIIRADNSKADIVEKAYEEYSPEFTRLEV